MASTSGEVVRGSRTHIPRRCVNCSFVVLRQQRIHSMDELSNSMLNVLSAWITPGSSDLCGSYIVLQEYERAVIFRNGRLKPGGARGPGMVKICSCIEEEVIVDLRTESFEVPWQQILTKDSVTVAVNAVVFYRIVDPMKAIAKVEDWRESTRFLAATAVRDTLGTRDLTQLLADRETLSHKIQATLEEPSFAWGVLVERVDIKDIALPDELQKVMAQEAAASREARAKIILAKGEVKAAAALKEASLLMVDDPMSLQLRYLQALKAISADKNSTIIFPFPMDLFKSALGK